MTSSESEVAAWLDAYLRTHSHRLRHKDADRRKLVARLAAEIYRECPVDPVALASSSTDPRAVFGPSFDAQMSKCVDHVTSGRPRMSEFDFMRVTGRLWSIMVDRFGQADAWTWSKSTSAGPRG